MKAPLVDLHRVVSRNYSWISKCAIAVVILVASSKSALRAATFQTYQEEGDHYCSLILEKDSDSYLEIIARRGEPSSPIGILVMQPSRNWEAEKGTGSAVKIDLLNSEGQRVSFDGSIVDYYWQPYAVIKENTLGAFANKHRWSVSVDGTVLFNVEGSISNDERDQFRDCYTGTAREAFETLLDCPLWQAVYTSGRFNVQFGGEPECAQVKSATCDYEFVISIHGPQGRIEGFSRIPNGFPMQYYALDYPNSDEGEFPNDGGFYFIKTKRNGEVEWSTGRASLFEPAPSAVVLPNFARSYFQTQRGVEPPPVLPDSDIFTLSECKR